MVIVAVFVARSKSSPIGMVGIMITQIHQGRYLRPKVRPDSLWVRRW